MEEPFNPRLLRLAREAHGWPQAELSRRAGLNQASISKYEKGLRTPEKAHRQALASALSLPNEFFADAEAKPAGVLYRSRSLRSAKLEATVRARLNLARLTLRRLMSGVDVEAIARFPEPDEAFADPQSAAAELRQRWWLPDGPLEDLTGAIEAAGGIVAHVDFGTDEAIAAYMHPLGDHTRWFFVNSRVSAGDRVRFSLAHELGHAVLHESEMLPDSREAETESNLFAGALLIPEQGLLADWPRGKVGMADLVDLKHRWLVSLQTLIMRARQIELLKPDEVTRLFKEISYRGWRRHEPGYVPVEEPVVLPSVLAIHRDEHRIADEELGRVAMTGLPLLRDLFPRLFPVSPKDRLRVVSNS